MTACGWGWRRTAAIRSRTGARFHTDDVAALREEFAAGGAGKIGEIKSETRPDGSKFDAFFVIAPDGLCLLVRAEKIEPKRLAVEAQ